LNQKNKINHRESFRDIAFGHSSFLFNKEVVYIKHLSVFDQIHIEEVRESFFEKAKRLGLQTTEESVTYLKENEIWTKEDERLLDNDKADLKALKDTRKNLYLSSEIKKVDERIKKAEEKYNHSHFKKQDLIGQTSEKYAEKRVSEHYILCSFYRDTSFTSPFFSQEEVDELEHEELSFVINEYNNKYSCFDDTGIQEIVLQDFFQMYISFCEDVRNFYDKPLFKLSTNQVKLIVYARMFKSIFENYPKIPVNIKKDPEKIIDYVNSQDKAKDVLQNVGKEGASTIMGAKKEDYENLGIKEISGKSLSAILKEKGGKMDMKDIMSAMGS